jgi:hypothetical protein
MVMGIRLNLFPVLRWQHWIRQACKPPWRVFSLIREIVDALVASANFARTESENTFQDENTASADLLKGHLLGEDEDP